MIVPVPSGLTRPLIVAVSLIDPPTVALVATVEIPGVAGLTVEVSPSSPHAVVAPSLLPSPEKLAIQK